MESVNGVVNLSVNSRSRGAERKKKRKKKRGEVKQDTGLGCDGWVEVLSVLLSQLHP